MTTDTELSALRLQLAQVTGRLRQLEDERAVLDTLYAYHHCLGNQDRAGFLNCFDADAVLVALGAGGAQVYAVRGRAALAEWFDRRVKHWPAGTESHAYVSPRLRMEGDRAEATGFFVTMSMNQDARDAEVADAMLVLRSSGQYTDRLSRSSDGAWRIVERRTQIRMTNRQSFR